MFLRQVSYDAQQSVKEPAAHRLNGKGYGRAAAMHRLNGKGYGRAAAMHRLALDFAEVIGYNNSNVNGDRKN